MNAIGPKTALQFLRWPLLSLALGTAIAALLVTGSHYHLNQQRKDDLASRNALREAEQRLSNANRETEDLRASAEAFEQIVAQGAFQPENRLEWIEAARQLKSRYGADTLAFDLAAQRNVALPGGRTYPSIDILGSRSSFKAQFLHEGDMLGFLDDLAKTGNGFHPLEHCLLRVLDDTPGNPLAPHVEASCRIDWITLKDKKIQAPASQGKGK
jgi:hypothetical protein